MTSDEVRQVKFREKLRGYHPTDVDAFIEQVAAELDAGRSPAALAREVRFRDKLRGYHPSDVDEFIEKIAAL